MSPTCSRATGCACWRSGPSSCVTRRGCPWTVRCIWQPARPPTALRPEPSRLGPRLAPAPGGDAEGQPGEGQHPGRRHPGVADVHQPDVVDIPRVEAAGQRLAGGGRPVGLGGGAFQPLPGGRREPQRRAIQRETLRGSEVLDRDHLGLDALHAAQEANLVAQRSEEHTSELQSLMSISYAVFCLKKKNIQKKKYTQ